MMKKSAWGGLAEKGVDGVDVSFLERMEVKWGGRRDFRVRKDTPRRVPPLKGKRNVVSHRLASLQNSFLKITETERLPMGYYRRWLRR